MAVVDDMEEEVADFVDDEDGGLDVGLEGGTEATVAGGPRPSKDNRP